MPLARIPAFFGNFLAHAADAVLHSTVVRYSTCIHRCALPSGGYLLEWLGIGRPPLSVILTSLLLWLKLLFTIH